MGFEGLWFRVCGGFEGSEFRVCEGFKGRLRA